MADYNEEPFERELCEYLAAHGWLYSKNGDGYDRERALFPADVLGWLAETQPEAYAKAVKPSGDVTKQEAALLNRVVQALDIPLEAGGGTLNVLRSGVQVIGAGRLSLVEFKPETTLNAETVERYAEVRLRVMRQCYYSTINKNSIDLVFFINGLPVATAELKTDFTQSVEEAIKQYKTDRLPKVGSHTEPLLGFGSRALVHFAVSNSEVYMTTRLDGAKTHFLPFNQGHDHGGGNSPNPNGSATSYLWEQVLERDSWLNIIGRLMHLETRITHDPITGAAKKSTTLLFPRFHQWQVVRELTQAVTDEGVGHKYLIQHSAGSGKTNSIAWTAHRMARLHVDNQKVFDSVIVVVDRSVLDSQLQEAIRQLDKQDIVVAVNEEEIRRAGARSKSDLLAKALTSGKLIVVVTIQTFPHAMDAIRENKGLAGKKFAVIADEAHSSQSGQVASKLRAVLTSEEAQQIEAGDTDLSVEDVLAAEATERAGSQNISYFAFTATPKGKTLELFGRKEGTADKPQPFHVYSMKQAIDEGFILDVLRGYQTYSTAFQIAQNAQNSTTASGDEVDVRAATKALMRWVRLHPTNVAQKVEIIVEHFRQNVAHLLDGHAKAMVVTDSRKAAVAYKHQIDAYITKHDYAMKTMVAFSGEVDYPEYGPDRFTEANMNPGVFDLAKAFSRPEYKIMLVANKFQTGFDQPLLSAMYVDKQLSGVTAVQTLSRLNRTYRAPSGEQKTKTFVLDFVNTHKAIKDAFEPYYLDAYLEEETDPYVVVNLATKLSQAAIYTDEQVTATASAWVLRKGNNALSACVAPAQQAFAGRMKKALEDDHRSEVQVLQDFRKDVGTYVRMYDFLSQIVDYGDPHLEELSIFLRLLERVIREENWSTPPDLSDVVLTTIRQKKGEAHDIALGEGGGLKGASGAGTGQQQDPKMAALQAIIDQINALFGDEAFTSGEVSSFVNALVSKLLENADLVQQAKANTKKQFTESPDLTEAVTNAVADNEAAFEKLAAVFFTEGEAIKSLIRLIAAALYEQTHGES